MHDHEEMIISSSGGISSMTFMWILMGLMAIHHISMWLDMRKMKKQKNCSCNQ
jgi:hypothetical protein